jgi:hypothetical protein
LQRQFLSNFAKTRFDLITLYFHGMRQHAVLDCPRIAADNGGTNALMCLQAFVHRSCLLTQSFFYFFTWRVCCCFC